MLDDEFYMRKCLDLARRAEGRTSPNPLVGAVVVDANGQIIGSGYHQKAGEPHAEVFALDEAGERARGQTLYVNLEPCCHHGRTPPCSDKVIASGVRTVVFGMADPNPEVAGGGRRALEQAGITVRSGVLEDDCRRLNRAFVKWISTKRPWVCLKIAATLDGRIADRFGKSRWITGERAREHVHSLRDKYDCVMIGAGTARADDPELTVRGIPEGRNPVRLVLDATLSIAPDSKLCQATDGKTWLFATEDAISSRSQIYGDNVRLVAAPAVAPGILDLDFVLKYVADQRLISILCEGGSRLSTTLLRFVLVDELEWLIAPKLLMDSQATPAIALDEPIHLDAACNFTWHQWEQLGDDLLFRGFLRRQSYSTTTTPFLLG